MRATYLDNLRGVAVYWMILFHFCYDMRVVGLTDWNFSSGFWFAFPRIIAFTFLFCVGLSLNFSHRPHVRWKALGMRSLKIGGAAAIVSLSTYLAFPEQWIYFGTLHCICLGSVLGALVVNHRRFALFLLILILFTQYVLDFDISYISSVLKRPSMDFIPIYPWFWAILSGMLIGPYLSKIKALENMPEISWLSTPGRHSLKIYLLHQPLIYGLLWGVKSLL
ncbi:MAG TPA: heparan-alpha-glucosaminide N-acetyltransferase [Bacteriovoracaceae bacterium]|nr:heparan-alpha-glucosaminide N-acetyltransferase [Bacteriovoracaceae bacterium]